MLDLIKDSGRFVVDVAQASEYYYWEGTLLAGQTFYSPVLDIQGKARVAYLWVNRSTSVGNMTSMGLHVSYAQDFHVSFVRASSSNVAPGGTGAGDIVSPARFIRFYVIADGTNGDHNFVILAAIHPVS
ncbi:hypothetical protein H5T88_07910 [bacterium]|nr:hypothetical protein [bacterium]